MKKAQTHKNMAKKDHMFDLQIMKPLTLEIKKELYDLYVEMWNEYHKKPEPKKPKEKSFKDKINEFVITHRDELLTPEEFKNVIRTWNRNMTIDQAYKYQQDKFFALPGVSVTITEPKDVNKLGFKNKDKYKFCVGHFLIRNDSPLLPASAHGEERH